MQRATDLRFPRSRQGVPTSSSELKVVHEALASHYTKRQKQFPAGPSVIPSAAGA